MPNNRFKADQKDPQRATWRIFFVKTWASDVPYGSIPNDPKSGSLTKNEPPLGDMATVLLRATTVYWFSKIYSFLMFYHSWSDYFPGLALDPWFWCAVQSLRQQLPVLPLLGGRALNTWGSFAIDLSRKMLMFIVIFDGIWKVPTSICVSKTGPFDAVTLSLPRISHCQAIASCHNKTGSLKGSCSHNPFWSFHERCEAKDLALFIPDGFTATANDLFWRYLRWGPSFWGMSRTGVSQSFQKALIMISLEICLLDLSKKQEIS